jgi:2-polyprenyl-3-methyl-5-hydroxy-6-metoxy-1,4-benzoquinol methylase
MRPGPLIRRSFGLHERAITEIYRSLFVNLDGFATRLRSWVPRPAQVLEVGCGEGAMTERLVKAYPGAEVTAIDISPNVGRLYRGDEARVTFLQRQVDEFARHESARFDLVVLCDVLHHVPPVERQSLLSAIERVMKPDGSLACKDWIASYTPIHWLCWLSDRYLTGDEVKFFTRTSLKALFTGTFGCNAVRYEAMVRPWRNNVAYLVRR